MVESALSGCPAAFLLGSGHERAPVLLFVLLLAGMAGGVLILLHLAFEAVEDRSDRLLAQGMVGGDVKELLGGSWALTSQLVNQGLIGGPRQESSYNVSIGDVRQLVALPEEATNVSTEGFSGLLLAVFEIPWVPRMLVHALEIPHEDLSQVCPTLDSVGWKVLQPCSCRIGQEQWKAANNEVIIIHSTSLASKLIILEP